MAKEKILFQIEKTEFIDELKRQVTTVKPKTYFITDPTQPYHTEFGMIPPEELKKKSGSQFTIKGKDYVIIDADFIDRYKRLPRGAQVIPIKDIGTIIGYTGINKDSTVVDAGAGSGANCIMIANIAKRVISYEKRDDFYNVVRKNIEAMGIKNIQLKKGDVYKKIDERDVDVITFDLPEPWLALPQANKALKKGGFLVVYNPSVPQISDFADAIRKTDEFIIVKIIEIIEREWEFKKRKVRPKSRGLGHSGFLCFARKIK